MNSFKRHLIERFKFFRVLIKFIAFALITVTSASRQHPKVCTTKACKDEAEKMLSKIDDSVELCEDFFGFACGNYKPEIPNDKTKIDELSLIQDTLQKRLNDVMSAPIKSDDIEPFRKAKMFYHNCIDKGIRM